MLREAIMKIIKKSLAWLLTYFILFIILMFFAALMEAHRLGVDLSQLNKENYSDIVFKVLCCIIFVNILNFFIKNLKKRKMKTEPAGRNIIT